MAVTQLNAPRHAGYPIRRAPRGVVKVTEAHESRYTITGNHLAQHRELSCTAIGLAVHIQSLRDGSPVDIRTLAQKLPEGRDRIAAALRELEKHGYIERVRQRLDDGTWTTFTYAYNNPAATAARRAREAAGGTSLVSSPEPAPKMPATPLPPARTEASVPVPVPPAPAAPPRPPLPSPTAYAPALHRTAADLLTGLREQEPRLTLAERDVQRLTPAVAAWLERGTHPDAVRRALTTGLPPEPLHHPAGFLAHRVTALLPPPLPTSPAPPRPDLLQNCDVCDRAFRAPQPGRCRVCRTTRKEAT
ncbi:hypothetical protein ACFU5O_29925 [Streptomyces sp. NPDC057445]|uniref:hypothetical protein n=1 Tax=Streptomyces sp. NPDC057445 TaxID=3346136 RepID=UPI0036CBB838